MGNWLDSEDPKPYSAERGLCRRSNTASCTGWTHYTIVIFVKNEKIFTISSPPQIAKLKYLSNLAIHGLQCEGLWYHRGINHRCSTEGTKIRYQNLTTGSSTNPTGSVAVRTLDTRTSTKRITDEVGPIVATYLASNSIVQLNWQVPLVGSSSDRINGLTDASRGRFMLYIRALQLRYWWWMYPESRSTVQSMGKSYCDGIIYYWPLQLSDIRSSEQTSIST